ncbi:MAG: TIGR01459 family HAD-type hydrolase [Rickettsiales bacterium]|nr:TIGR01459 family HAD-type hydrolase [Rickettsiales bacterium]
MQKFQFQEPKFINGLSAVYNNYDGFIIDLWGVLHDGTSAYPKALEMLKNLKNSGKKITLLSNAPRRSFMAKKNLDRLGFTEDLYDFLITSGEITFEFVKQNNLGKNYFYIGPDKDRDILEGLNVTEVSNANEAEFALATGFEGFGSVFEEKKNQVDEALKAGLKLLCANPDFKVVKQTGEEQICSGLIAKYYEENGGRVIYFGKPYISAYQKCFELMNINLELNSKIKNKVLCIGDSIHTDILGANNCNSSGLFVAGGIHKQDFVEDGYLNLTKMADLCNVHHAQPTYIIKEFFW